MSKANDTDVIVVGAGPVGLMLAAELALAGVTVQVIERLREPDETIKAGSINIPTAEALARRGLLTAARRIHQQTRAEIQAFFETTAARADSMPRRPAGQFAAFMLDRAKADDTDPEIADHAFVSDATLVPQRAMEALLTEHAQRLGVILRRGVTVTDIHVDESDDHEPTVTVDTDAGAARAAWLVGCDGGRSRVRKHAGFDFPGTDAEITGHQAIVDIADPEKLTAGWTWGPNGVYSYGPLPGRILTVEFDRPPADRSAPVSLEELQASLRRVSDTDVTLTAVHGGATRWTDNARQADTYRRGRVLLAGDAAHVHSPFSGQGLNLGIGDAMNLGWKLAATIHGWAPDGLLDTYTAERHRIGAWVLDWTRAQVALMRGDRKTAALRSVVGDMLRTREGMTYVIKHVSGVNQHNDLPGTHPAIGRAVPDITLADGSRLSDYGHDGRFVFLDRRMDKRLGEIASAWDERVIRVVNTDGSDQPSLLVRPDGLVAWAGDSRQAADLEKTLRSWAGGPAHPAQWTGKRIRTLPCEQHRAGSSR